jgi:hypothetical protein
MCGTGHRSGFTPFSFLHLEFLNYLESEAQFIVIEFIRNFGSEHSGDDALYLGPWNDPEVQPPTKFELPNEDDRHFFVFRARTRTVAVAFAAT